MIKGTAAAAVESMIVAKFYFYLRHSLHTPIPHFPLSSVCVCVSTGIKIGLQLNLQCARGDNRSDPNTSTLSPDKCKICAKPIKLDRSHSLAGPGESRTENVTEWTAAEIKI